MERARHRDLGDGYFERHHIVPRCMRGTDDPANIVKLTPEEHYLAHQLLVKIHPGHIGVAMALKAMLMNHGRRSNKTYGWTKRVATRAASERMRINNPNGDGEQSRRVHAQYREKHGRNRPGPEMSTEGLERIRESKLGSKNPMAGKKPWENPRATEYSKSVWASAQSLYELWVSNQRPSYGRLFFLYKGECFTKSGGGVIAPYTNIVKYFRSGWIPETDEVFQEFRSKYTHD